MHATKELSEESSYLSLEGEKGKKNLSGVNKLLRRPLISMFQASPGRLEMDCCMLPRGHVLVSLQGELGDRSILGAW